MIKNRRYRVRFDYRPGHSTIRAWEYVTAPSKLLALWNAREQRHGCIIADPDCIKETIGIVRDRTQTRDAHIMRAVLDADREEADKS